MRDDFEFCARTIAAPVVASYRETLAYFGGPIFVMGGLILFLAWVIG